MERLKRNMDIIIILVVGFILRFSISITHSYSNDELSAINRLQHDNFSDLIEFGVMKGDMHPAGVQVFMKMWSKVAGVNELGMRLPFVLFGCLSIFILFRIGAKWVNRETGLIAAAFLALLYFPIMNSEFARPYSPGLLFSLLAAWYYLKLLFEDSPKYKDAILMGLSCAAAMYSHYFAFLFIGWLSVSGLLFVKKRNLKYVLLAGGVAIVLFLPHISVSAYHYGVEGGLGWLENPTVTWLFEFIYHAFNESWIVLLGIAIAIGLTFWMKEKLTVTEKRVIYLSAIWFFGIYLVGHVFSIVKTPVLKFPVMLFALPFILLLIASFLSRFKYQGALLSGLMLVLGTSTIKEKDLYGNMHYELFEEIGEHIVRWEDTYGKDNVYVLYNLNNPNYMNFYTNQWGKDIKFDRDVIEYGEENIVRKELLYRTENYCVVGYSARHTVVQIFETAKEFYPYILEQYEYNNSSVALLGRFPPGQDIQDSKRLDLFNPMTSNDEWNYNEEFIKTKGQDSTSRFLKFYELSGDNIYGPELILDVGSIEDRANKYLYVEAYVDQIEDLQLSALFVGIRDGNDLMNRGEKWHYTIDIEDMIASSGRGYISLAIPKFFKNSDQIKISFWNRNPSVSAKVGRVNVHLKENIWN